MPKEKLEITVEYDKDSVDIDLKNSENVKLFHIQQCGLVKIDYSLVKVEFSHLIEHLVGEIQEFQKS